MSHPFPTIVVFVCGQDEIPRFGRLVLVDARAEKLIAYYQHEWGSSLPHIPKGERHTYETKVETSDPLEIATAIAVTARGPFHAHPVSVTEVRRS